MDDMIYRGNDLGAKYCSEHTLFKVWSPVAKKIKVVIYDTYNDLDGKAHDMHKEEKGVWELKLKGDHKNKYYNYRVTIHHSEKEISDPYTKGATVNGTKGMIVDFTSINPEGWEDHPIPLSLKSTQSIIYEMHVRDFSVDKDSGMKNKGKYLAFTEVGTKEINGLFTGIDHLKEMGITHIHLLPIFDFESIDERKDEEYNWGYDPYLYFVPEGSYATNPYDGTMRIIELKKMVKALHENNIRVVMDVVFNHTFNVGNTPFDILVPKYYYRTYNDGTYANGSGCGNEIASEKPMVRKFIIDCVKFWAREYKIDGFRFDLMALHDIKTMKQIKEELKKTNPNILIYGEPWTGGPSALDPKEQFRKGCQKGMDIGVFNDDYRNALKGDNNHTGPGFVSGAKGLENEVKKGIAGSICYNDEICGFAEEPGESINYVSSHDNLTLFDKIQKSSPDATDEERERMNRLALSMILTSQGVAFIQGGSEILRSKGGNHNSYKAGDEVNKIDWNMKNKHIETFKYIKGLIVIRKSQKVMTMERAEDIMKNLYFINSPNNTVAYILNSPYEEDYRHIFIVHNANKKEVMVQLPLEGQWKTIANEFEANQHGVMNGIQSYRKEVKVAPLSTYILVQ